VDKRFCLWGDLIVDKWREFLRRGNPQLMRVFISIVFPAGINNLSTHQEL